MKIWQIFGVQKNDFQELANILSFRENNWALHLGPHLFEIAVQLREMAGGGAGGGEPGGELLRRELGESEGGAGWGVGEGVKVALKEI